MLLRPLRSFYFYQIVSNFTAPKFLKFLRNKAKYNDCRFPHMFPMVLQVYRGDIIRSPITPLRISSSWEFQKTTTAAEKERR